MTMRFQLEPLHRNTPDADFLYDSKRVAAELGATTVSMAQYDQRGKFSASSLQRRFGSWRQALDRAGLVKVRKINPPEDELFNNLAALWTHKGRQPRMSDVTAQSSRMSADTYKRRFGSWRKALEAFVEWANAEKQASEESIDAAIGSAIAPRRGPRDPSLRLRFLVMRRDSFKCRYCGRSPATEPAVELNVDHIKAWAEGGLTVLENLQTLCTKCNSGKSNLPAEGTEQRLGTTEGAS
jgi:hypothetical protein